VFTLSATAAFPGKPTTSPTAAGVEVSVVELANRYVGVTCELAVEIVSCTSPDPVPIDGIPELASEAVGAEPTRSNNDMAKVRFRVRELFFSNGFMFIEQIYLCRFSQRKRGVAIRTYRQNVRTDKRCVFPLGQVLV
jgi:hypothetical protein